MATFNPLYTGENSSVEMPELDSLSRAMQRKGDMAIKGEELKLDKALKDKATFQKMLNIDPIVAVSTKNAERQAIELEKYNNKWAAKYVQNKGELSFADELEMAKDRKLLEATQGKMLADQKQYQAYKDTILRDTRGYYDKRNFEAKEQEYFQTGVLPQGMMDIAPQSMTAWLRARSKEMPTTTVSRRDDMGRIIDSKVVDKTDAQNVILEGMQEEARLKQTLMDFEQWSSNPANEKQLYDLLKDYDSDGNGKISPEESQYAYQNTSIASNPIAKWAMNNPVYLESVMGQKEGTSKAPPATRKPTNSGNFVSLDIGMGTPVKYQPTDRQSFKNYKTYHAVPEWPTQNIPADNITVQKPTGEKVKVVGKTLSLQLTGYDEEKDEFTFITKTNYWGENTMGAGDQIAIARKDVPPKFNDFEILVNGIRFKVGEIKKESATATATTTAQTTGASGVVWGKKK